MDRRQQPRSSNVPLRIPALDGLRGCAILFVLLYHYVAVPVATSYQPAGVVGRSLLALGIMGWSGVDLFFVLSGFLIGGILLDARESRAYYRVFYARRFFRIVPLYALLLGVFFACRALTTAGLTPGIRWLVIGEPDAPWWSYATFTQNFWMAAEGAFGAHFLAVTWSLAIEEQFYLTMPLLVRWLRSRALLFVLATLIVAAPVLRVLVYLRGDALAPYFLMPCRADALAMGMLAAFGLRRYSSRTWIERHRRAIVALLGVLTTGVVYLSLLRLPIHGPVMISVGYTLIALFFVTLLILTVTRSEGRLARALSQNWLRQFGQLAYCIYLTHLIVLWAVKQGLWIAPRPGEVVATMIAFGMTVGLAWLSWGVFERPLLAIGQRFRY